VSRCRSGETPPAWCSVRTITTCLVIIATKHWADKPAAPRAGAPPASQAIARYGQHAHLIAWQRQHDVPDGVRVAGDVCG
jgi:hypothetical protein